MGLNGATATGAVAIENCSSGPGSCGVNCSKPCSSSGYWCAYPHFTECGSTQCNVKTDLPKGKSCGNQYEFAGCKGTVYPKLYDCGPSATALNTVLCGSYKAEAIGCINSAGFSAIAGNPSNGVAYITIR
jgi:hypothetical protein